MLAAIGLFGIGLIVARFASPLNLQGWGDGPNLRGAVLVNARLESADLAGVDLRGVNLRGAVLAGTSLLNANLTGADMRRADLTGARLDGASLRGVRLGGADASGARGLHTVDLTYAQYDASTRWPDGFDPATRGAVLVPPAVPRASASRLRSGQ